MGLSTNLKNLFTSCDLFALASRSTRDDCFFLVSDLSPTPTYPSHLPLRPHHGNVSFDGINSPIRVTKEGLMYPNPSSEMVHGSEHLRLFEFLGRILGKALYEGITVRNTCTFVFLWY